MRSDTEVRLVDGFTRRPRRPSKDAPARAFPQGGTARGAWLAVVVALMPLVAGCADPAEPADGEASTAGPGAPAVAFEAVPGAGPAAVPHVHDYWAGRERVTLLREEITVEPPTAAMWGVQTTRFIGETSFGGAFVEFPEGAIVYEGTGRLEVTVTWNDPGITGMRFLHRHAGSGEIQPWTETPNGETIALDVMPEMTDMPHAQSSRWVLLFAASGTPAIALGTFTVQVDIVKTRDVAEWPAHPDLWGGADEVALADAEGRTASRVAPAEAAETDPWAEPADAIHAQALVPMETATLRVVVTVLGTEGHLEAERLHLFVRTASDVMFDFDDVGEPTHVSDDGLTWTWDLPVEMEQTDNPYASTSAWAFRATAGALEADVPECGQGCYEPELSYHLHASAVKTGAEA